MGSRTVRAALAAALSLLLGSACGQGNPAPLQGPPAPAIRPRSAPEALVQPEQEPAPGTAAKPPMDPESREKAERLARLQAKVRERRQAQPRVEPEPAPPQPVPDDVAQKLASNYPVDRAEAVRELDPSGQGLDRLLEILRFDPAPEVRAAAASQVGLANGYGAVHALIEALDDPDPRVVTEAVTALETSADESVVPQLLKLLDHPDEGVRIAAEEAIQVLQ